MPNRIEARAPRAEAASKRAPSGDSRSSSTARTKTKAPRGVKKASVPEGGSTKAQTTALRLIDNLTRDGNSVVLAGPGGDSRLAGYIISRGQLDNGSSVAQVLSLKESGLFHNATLMFPPVKPSKGEATLPMANSTPASARPSPVLFGSSPSAQPSNLSSIAPPIEVNPPSTIPIEQQLAMELMKEVIGWNN